MTVPELKNESEFHLDPSKKSICLVQITRFGDLIQTAFVARELKKERNDVDLYLIARSNFARPLNFLLKDLFQKIFLIDTKAIINFQNPHLQDAMKRLTDFIDLLNKSNIGILVNLSFSKTSSYLCSLINSDIKVGPYYGEKLNIIINDRWSQFFYSNVLRGPLCPFSLVDIYRKILGLEKRPNTKTTSFLRKDVILVHPFASLLRKMWKTNKWVEVIYKILKDHPSKRVVIVGSKSEINSSLEITSSFILAPFRKRIFNKTGKTSLSQLAKIVKDSYLFVGHDSMVGHLASYYEIPTFTISLGSVRPIETTPYTDRGYNIVPRIKCFPCFPQSKCDFYQCHNDISYQVVCSCIDQLIKNNKIAFDEMKKNISQLHLNSVDVYKSNFSKKGMLFFECITDNYPCENDIFRKYYRIVWQFYLSDLEEIHDFPPLTDPTYKGLLYYTEGLQYLYELSEFGKRYSKYILEEISSKTPSLSKIRKYSKKIQEIDDLSVLVKEGYPHLYPIIDYFLVIKGNLSGTNLSQITENSFLAHHNCSLLISVIYELIEKSIGKYKVEISQEMPK